MFNAIRQSARSANLVRATRRPANVASPLRAFPSVRTLVTKRYTQDHEAVVFDDATGVGIVTVTDYAQSSLGDVVFVELPAVGTVVKQGDQIGAVESVKAASDIYAPVSGTVKEINETLSTQPGLLNKSPEIDGWLCKIELSDAQEITSLMDDAAYKAHCEH
ncbi:hypothetical protein EUX98_g4107 [Antrodiella citrinella]|uniref:Glycine cleavage system H protein n=1 Tax=Antrodiella citrinella TaxID=2447956 RepID=A0A4S4N2V9_9APHY|nr:hypothetical protein EUX98_g4107 [Antrodiella citrinella]